MARAHASSWLRVLGALLAASAAGQAASACDVIAGVHILNTNEEPAGGSGGGSSSSGLKEVVCSPEALSCSSCADCGDVVEVTMNDLGAPTSPSVPIVGSTSGKSRSSARVSVECKQAEGPERIYAVHVGKSGFLTAKLSRAGTAFDSVLYARKGCCDTFDPSTQCNDSRKAQGDHNYHGGEVISFRVTAGEVWYLLVDGTDSLEQGSYALDLDLSSGVSCVDQGFVPIAVEAGSPMQVSGDTHALGNEGHNRCFLNHPSGAGTSSEIVYELRAPTDVTAFDLSLNGTFDTVLYARSDCVDNNFGTKTELACVDDNNGRGGEYIEGLPNSGGPIYVFVDTGPVVADSYEYTLTVTPR